MLLDWVFWDIVKGLVNYVNYLALDNVAEISNSQFKVSRVRDLKHYERHKCIPLSDSEYCGKDVLSKRSSETENWIKPNREINKI